jgi:hypothetical protein
MFTLLCDIWDVIRTNWFSQEARFDEADFNEKVIRPIIAEGQGKESAKHRREALVHMPSTKPYPFEWNLARMDELYLKRTLHQPFGPNIPPISESDTDSVGNHKCGSGSKPDQGHSVKSDIIFRSASDRQNPSPNQSPWQIWRH